MKVTLIECENLTNGNSEGTAWPISYLLGNITALKKLLNILLGFMAQKPLI